MELTHLDLFSGIGGFALSARWAGLKTIQFVELDKFCCKVLNKNFPGVPIHNDIKTFKYNETSAQPFLLTGGFPCQPFSCAGKQRGTEDNRYLWPEMLRVISEAKPRWIIGENVRGFISNNNGMVFENCCLDLEREGYSVQAFIIPACSVNAPHRRDRVWIVGHSTDNGCQRGISNGKGGNNKQPCCEGIGERFFDKTLPTGFINEHDASNSGGDRLSNRGDCNGDNTEGTQISKNITDNGNKIRGESFRCNQDGGWEQNWLEVATRLCRVDDGLPAGLVRPKGWRVNSLKALGNAVVPQIPYILMKAILEAERSLI